MTQVSMMVARVFVGLLEERGVSPEQFLADAGLSALALDDAAQRVSLTDYSKLVRATLSCTGDPAFGLHMGERAEISFDVIGHLTEHSRTLREALQFCARYARIVTDGPAGLELREDGDSATIQLNALTGESLSVRMAAEFSTSALLRVIHRFVGPHAQPQRVLFAYEAPLHRAEYTRIFSGRELFSQELTGFVFERSWLERTQLACSTELATLLQTRAEWLLAKLERDAPLEQRVIRWLAAQSCDAKLTADVVARSLGMSARSLRRGLDKEQVQLSELLDAARAANAKTLLVKQQRSVQETAYAMGFDSPAAFSRAFKRWTGQSPNVYRSARRMA